MCFLVFCGKIYAINGVFGMIGVFDLEVLLKNYGIDYEKVLENNEKILSLGEYSDIKKVLDYLILELGLPTKNIEK